MGNIHVKFGPVVKEAMSLKDIGPFVMQFGTICAILVEGIKSNNSVKLF